MNLEDIPALKGNQYPARITISLSAETKRKLELLKRVNRKDTAELVRMLLDDFLKKVDFKDAV